MRWRARAEAPAASTPAAVRPHRALGSAKSERERSSSTLANGSRGRSAGRVQAGRLPSWLLALLLATSMLLVAGCATRPQRKLLTDKPGQSAAGGLTWKCGLLGGGLGAAVGFGASMGGTALTTEKWPLNEPIDWVETIPVWGSAVFLGSALGMFIACIGP